MLAVPFWNPPSSLSALGHCSACQPVSTSTGTPQAKQLVGGTQPHPPVGGCCQLLSPVCLCEPMDCSMPGCSLLNYLLEFAQIALSWWCYLTISSGGHKDTGASVSAAVLPMNIQGWFPLGLIGFDWLISSQSNRLSRVFSSTTVWKHQFSSAQAPLWSNSHNCTWLLEEP